MATTKKKSHSIHKAITKIEDTEASKQPTPVATANADTSRRQDILNTTVKIVSTFSDMLNTWKDNKVKRYKKRLVIWLSVVGAVVLVSLIFIVILFAAKIL